MTPEDFRGSRATHQAQILHGMVTRYRQSIFITGSDQHDRIHH